MENICIDSDILIDFLRNKSDAVDWIKKNERSALLATTTINLFELFFGAYKSIDKGNVQQVRQLAQRLAIITPSSMSAELAGKQLAHLEQEGASIDFRDMLIGTTALCEGFGIKTNNKKHFSKMSGLILVD